MRCAFTGLCRKGGGVPMHVCKQSRSWACSKGGAGGLVACQPLPVPRPSPVLLLHLLHTAEGVVGALMQRLLPHALQWRRRVPQHHAHHCGRAVRHQPGRGRSSVSNQRCKMQPPRQTIATTAAGHGCIQARSWWQLPPPLAWVSLATWQPLAQAYTKTMHLHPSYVACVTITRTQTFMPPPCPT